MALNIETTSNRPKQNTAAEIAKESEKTDVQETSQKKEAPNMVTIDRTKAENFLIILEESIGDVQELKNLVDTLLKAKEFELNSFQTETIEKFNNLIDTTRNLSEKLKTTESYEVYLEERVKNAKLDSEIALLEQQLQKEKAEVSSFLIETRTFLTQNMNQILEVLKSLKTADVIIEQKLKQFTDSLEAQSKKFTESCNKQLDDTSESLINGTNNQKSLLVSECNTMLKAYTEKCQAHLDAVQKQAIDFLKQCKAENAKLIERVPAVASKKLSKKDIIIYVMAVLGIASIIARLFV